MAAAAVPTLLMIGLLAFQLITVERQRRIAVRQEQRVISILEAAKPQAEELRAAVPELRELVPDLSSGLSRADDLVRAFARGDAPAALAAAGELAVDLTTGDRARILADRGNQLLAQLQDGDTLGDVQQTAQAVVELLAVVRELQSLAIETSTDVHTLTDATVPFLNESLGIQRELLSIQRETFTILRRSLAVQQETLRRVRNIDRRTGAVAPPPLDPVATP